MDISDEIPLNWRDPQDYSMLLDADRSLFAWEWLRRDPAYREAATTALRGCRQNADRHARRFGLVRFEPTHVSVPFARPLWLSEVNPQVLVGEVSAQADAGAFDLGCLRHLAYLALGSQTDHLLFTDGLRMIRIDAPSGAFAGKPLCLRLRVDRMIAGELAALRRLLALLRTGQFARSLHAPEPRARRWILQLRAHDALASGADLRNIAEVLLGRSSAGPGWRSRDPSLRSQAQRLVRSARALSNGGFRQLLYPPMTKEMRYWFARPQIRRARFRDGRFTSGEAAAGLR